jgi:hypothetical protein
MQESAIIQKIIENAVNTAIDSAVVNTQKSIAIQIREILYSPDDFYSGKLYKVIDEMEKGERNWIMTKTECGD